MNPSLKRALLPCALFLAPALAAQEGIAPPAPELQKLAPYIGNWAGSGTCNFVPGAPPTPWSGRGTYRWSHGKNFVQGDFEIAFEGNPSPMVVRSYMGWDKDRRRYAEVKVLNDGRAQLTDVILGTDGSLTTINVATRGGQTYVEHSMSKINGGSLVHSVSVLMSDGTLMKVVDAAYQKSDKTYDVSPDAQSFMGAAPTKQAQQIARMAGTYAVKGSMVMMPGMPGMNITGTDTYRTGFGGTVLFSHTDGAAENMPGKYEADSAYGYDEHRDCLVNVFVSNMGEIGLFEARFSEDGKSLITTTAGLIGGQPTTMRVVMELDEKGAAKKSVAHKLSGNAAPYESFTATYTKK